MLHVHKGNIMEKTERLRMFQWLLLTVVFYAVAYALKLNGDIFPSMQNVFYKLGHVSVGAYLGYFIDRNASRCRLTTSSPDAHHIRRAIIVGAAMLAVAYGL